jgi:hypothetical protein
MNKKVLMVLILALTGLFLVSCNTYYRCPAYSEVNVEIMDVNNV